MYNDKSLRFPYNGSQTAKQMCISTYTVDQNVLPIVIVLTSLYVFIKLFPPIFSQFDHYYDMS